jgi:hypothetical protein
MGTLASGCPRPKLYHSNHSCHGIAYFPLAKLSSPDIKQTTPNPKSHKPLPTTPTMKVPPITPETEMTTMAAEVMLANMGVQLSKQF